MPDSEIDRVPMHGQACTGREKPYFFCRESREHGFKPVERCELTRGKISEVRVSNLGVGTRSCKSEFHLRGLGCVRRTAAGRGIRGRGTRIQSRPAHHISLQIPA